MVDIYPPLPPRPFIPAGVKGSLNSQFLFLGLLETLVRALAIRICVLRWVAAAVVVNGLGLCAAFGSPFLCLLSFGEAKESSSANRPKPVFKKTLSNN